MPSGQDYANRLQDEIQKTIASQTKALHKEVQNLRNDLQKNLERVESKIESLVRFDHSFAQSLLKKAIQQVTRENEDKIYSLAFFAHNLREKETQEEILTSLLEESCKFAPRLALFIVREEQLVCWASRGYPDAVGKKLEECCLAPHDSTILESSLDADGLVTISDTSKEKSLLEHIPPLGPWHAFPLKALQRPVAVLLAAAAEKGACDLEPLCILMDMTGLAIENLALKILEEMRIPAAEPVPAPVAAFEEALEEEPVETEEIPAPFIPPPKYEIAEAELALPEVVPVEVELPPEAPPEAHLEHLEEEEIPTPFVQPAARVESAETELVLPAIVPVNVELPSEAPAEAPIKPPDEALPLIEIPPVVVSSVSPVTIEEPVISRVSDAAELIPIPEPAAEARLEPVETAVPLEKIPPVGTTSAYPEPIEEHPVTEVVLAPEASTELQMVPADTAPPVEEIPSPAAGIASPVAVEEPAVSEVSVIVESVPELEVAAEASVEPVEISTPVSEVPPLEEIPKPAIAPESPAVVEAKTASEVSPLEESIPMPEPVPISPPAPPEAVILEARTKEPAESIVTEEPSEMETLVEDIRAVLEAKEPAPTPQQAATPSPQIAAGPIIAVSPAPKEPVRRAEDDKLHNDAKRFARLLVSEIKLYNEQRVLDGRRNRDLYLRLKKDIDRSREMYEKRVSPAVAKNSDYFHLEIVRILGENDPSMLGSDYPGPRVES